MLSSSLFFSVEAIEVGTLFRREKRVGCVDGHEGMAGVTQGVTRTELATSTCVPGVLGYTNFSFFVEM